MPKRSATQRYQEMVNHYRRNVAGGRPVTMAEVAEWTIVKKLVPVPNGKERRNDADGRE